MGLIFALFDAASFQDMQLHQLQCLYHAKLIFVLLFAPFISPLLHWWWFVVCMLWLWSEIWASAVPAGSLFFVGMLSQEFEELEVKWSIVMHCHQLTHPLLNWWLAFTLMIKHSVFYKNKIDALIVSRCFSCCAPFSIYNGQTLGVVQHQI